MKTVFEDMWFPAGTRIRIGAGSEELFFLRCSFVGGEIFVSGEIDRPIFSQCVFQGTSFSGQPLSERISLGCRECPPETETVATGPAVSRPAKFRR
jgi:hypothetical protein